TQIAGSHAAVAHAVHSGRADAGIGIAAAARSLGLAFIALFDEPYEIALPADLAVQPPFTALLDLLASAGFRAAVRTLDGYAVPQDSGRVDIIE
ncbi:MAG: substrate-binding domain-containing protein, partial [Chloroflexota bacterium]